MICCKCQEPTDKNYNEGASETMCLFCSMAKEIDQKINGSKPL